MYFALQRATCNDVHTRSLDNEHLRFTRALDIVVRCWLWRIDVFRTTTCNVQRCIYTCVRCRCGASLHVALQHATCNVQRATCNVQGTTYNAQRATHNVQHARRKIKHAPCNVQRTTMCLHSHSTTDLAPVSPDPSYSQCNAASWTVDWRASAA
jgi:hypothetical protein